MTIDTALMLLSALVVGTAIGIGCVGLWVYGGREAERARREAYERNLRERRRDW